MRLRAPAAPAVATASSSRLGRREVEAVGADGCRDIVEERVDRIDAQRGRASARGPRRCVVGTAFGWFRILGVVWSAGDELAVGGGVEQCSRHSAAAGSAIRTRTIQPSPYGSALTCSGAYPSASLTAMTSPATGA